MGSTNSTPIEKDYIHSSAQLEVYALKKRRPGCTGMFWRNDPEHKLRLQSNASWPRDGALLKGEVRTVGGQQWLAATHVQQKGASWVEAPYGAFIPFEYDNHYYLEKLATK
jgi:hypothetical protein